MKTKRFFISVIAFVFTMVAWAQNNQSVTAILQHVENGTETVKVYIGKEAFKKAYADAVNGDAITLSSGNFDTPSPFQKELSVYGAGYEEDTASGTAVTTLNNSIVIENIESLSNLHFEGLNISSTITCRALVSNMVISKCLCDYVYLYGATNTDIMIQQCVIRNGVAGYNFSDYITKAENLIVKNCILGGVSIFDPTSIVKIDHCLLLSKIQNTDKPYVYPFVYTNCIFGKKGEPVNILGSLQYCIVPYYFSCNNPINVIDLRNAAVFTDGDWASSYSADRTYTLSNPEEWIGNDNTQIGIHGGMGFSKVPSTPVIRNMTVTPEGKKIKVNYETNVR